MCENNVFYKNRVSGNAPNPQGGGIFNNSSNAIITNNIFVGNSPDAAKGTISNFQYNCFDDNIHFENLSKKPIKTIIHSIGKLLSKIPLLVRDFSDTFVSKKISLLVFTIVFTKVSEKSRTKRGILLSSLPILVHYY